MANGNLTYGPIDYYDTESLIKYINKRGIWKPYNARRFTFNQAGTGSEVEVSEKGGETIDFAAADADVVIWAENDHADGRSLAWACTYLDSSGTKYSKSGILNAVDSTTEVVVTGDTDFYRLETLDIITTANTGYVAIGLTGKATIYGIVEEANENSIHSRYMCPVDTDAWLTEICIANAIATQLDCYMKITHTPYGETTEHVCVIPISQNNMVKVPLMLRLKAATEITFEIKGNLSDNGFDIYIVEAELM